MTDLPDDEKQRSEKLMSRREVLQSVGRFSLIAALALAGPSVLFQGCKEDKTTNIVGPDTNPAPDGSSPEQAIPINFGGSGEATIRSSDNMIKYYKFNPDQHYDISLVDITAVSFVSGTIARCTILNSSLSEWETQDFDGLDSVSFSVDAGTWYIKFEALQGGGVVNFRLTTETPETWDNYNDWSNYSDAWSNYSDTWSNYSDTWSNYSDTWSNYSDTWSNYSDYGAWGNWMESW